MALSKFNQLHKHVLHALLIIMNVYKLQPGMVFRRFSLLPATNDSEWSAAVLGVGHMSHVLEAVTVRMK